MAQKRILLIDDDESLCTVLSHQLTQSGYHVTTAHDGRQGLELFKRNLPDVVIADLQMPEMDGMEVLREIRRLSRDVVFIIITAYGTIKNAVEACHLGADDYITKPFGREELKLVIEKAIKVRNLVAENLQLRGQLVEKYQFDNLVGKSSRMEEVFKLAGKVAQSDATVLILGESGTGKELLARAIHYNSPRRDKPFIPVNCPSIPQNLLESELFGHVRGAFTGAIRDRKGKFELAEGGTLFLDEVGDLHLDLQAKLLRVLQEKEIERVGDSKAIKVNVRIVASTNRDLMRLMQEAKFREDLYYRLSVVPITIPPLRERKEDIPFLVDHFLHKYGKDKMLKLQEGFMETLMSYHWPGNVRELENAIERAVVLASGDTISIDGVRPLLAMKTSAAGHGDFEMESKDLSLADIEKKAILKALQKNDGNQTKAAQSLKIPRHVLLYKMKKLGIESTFPMEKS